jgi:hypothetical protein
MRFEGMSRHHVNGTHENLYKKDSKTLTHGRKSNIRPDCLSVSVWHVMSNVSAVKTNL